MCHATLSPPTTPPRPAPSTPLPQPAPQASGQGAHFLTSLLTPTQPPAPPRPAPPRPAPPPQLGGVTTNLEFLRLIAASPGLAGGATTTKFVEGVDYAPHAGGWAGNLGKKGKKGGNTERIRK